MSMSDRIDPAALKKRLKALEAQARDAQNTIDELKSRDSLKTQFLSNISHDLPPSSPAPRYCVMGCWAS